MSYSQDVATNVEFLEEKARGAAAEEMERATNLDQKSAGMIAADLVLVVAAVTFATQIDGVHVGHSAKTLWVAILILVMASLLASLAFATLALRPRMYRVAIHMHELDRWPRPSFLERDPTLVRGEQLRAAITLVREARPVNKDKAEQLGMAFRFFAAAVVATVVLGSAVGVRLADSSNHHGHRRTAGRAHSDAARAGI
jgi:hypothetical protein